MNEPRECFYEIDCTKCGELKKYNGNNKYIIVHLKKYKSVCLECSLAQDKINLDNAMAERKLLRKLRVEEGRSRKKMKSKRPKGDLTQTRRYHLNKRTIQEF